MTHSASYKKHYDVLIVGCGPSGATLANILRHKGHSIAIFDRDKDVFIAPRAMTIDGESCRIFQSIDVQDRLAKDDARPYLLHYFVDKSRNILCQFKFGDREGVDGYPAAGVRFHQPALEKFLRDDFSKGSNIVDAFYGYEVVDVNGEGPQAQLVAKHVDTGEIFEFTGRYIIGADGGASQTRKYIGGNRVDFNYSRQWLVIDILLHDQEAWDAIHEASEFMCRPDSAVVFVKGFHNHVRFDFEINPEDVDSYTEADALELIGNYINVDPKDVEFLRLAPYHFYAGMPDKWRKGRVLIMGDAAHLTSPFSGQGLCMGIRDAGNLGFKLDMVLEGLVEDSFLDTYQTERWEHCRHIIAGATERGKMISAATPLAIFQRYITFFIGRNMPKLAMELMRKSSIAFPYENGLVGTHKLAGYLAIQPTVQTISGEKRLMDDVTGNGFTLIMSESETNTDITWFKDVLSGTVNVIGQDFIDCEGKLSEYFSTHKISALIIRPDRYIFDAGPSASDLCANLKQQLSAYANAENVKQAAE